MCFTSFFHVENMVWLFLVCLFCFLWSTHMIYLHQRSYIVRFLLLLLFDLAFRDQNIIPFLYTFFLIFGSSLKCINYTFPFFLLLLFSAKQNSRLFRIDCCGDPDENRPFRCCCTYGTHAGSKTVHRTVSQTVDQAARPFASWKHNAVLWFIKL